MDLLYVQPQINIHMLDKYLSTHIEINCCWWCFEQMVMLDQLRKITVFIFTCACFFFDIFIYVDSQVLLLFCSFICCLF